LMYILRIFGMLYNLSKCHARSLSIFSSARSLSFLQLYNWKFVIEIYINWK
jgi:hypothetical protein